MYDEYNMLCKKNISQNNTERLANNKQLFVKSHGLVMVNELDTELNANVTNNASLETNDVNTIDYTAKLDIPCNSYLKPDIVKRDKSFKEWRWRIINIKHKSYAEISYYEIKTKKRFYMSGKTNAWEEQEIDSSFDNYVEKEYYCYT
jgi:hypothetical protein